MNKPFYCSSCGMTLNGDETKCPKCGVELKGIGKGSLRDRNKVQREHKKYVKEINRAVSGPSIIEQIFSWIGEKLIVLIKIVGEIGYNIIFFWRYIEYKKDKKKIKQMYKNLIDNRLDDLKYEMNLTEEDIEELKAEWGKLNYEPSYDELSELVLKKKKEKEILAIDFHTPLLKDFRPKVYKSYVFQKIKIINNIKYFELFSSLNKCEIEAIKSTLKNSEIDYYVFGEPFLIVNPLTEPVRFYVNEVQIEESKGILKDFIEKSI